MHRRSWKRQWHMGQQRTNFHCDGVETRGPHIDRRLRFAIRRRFGRGSQPHGSRHTRRLLRFEANSGQNATALFAPGRHVRASARTAGLRYRRQRLGQNDTDEHHIRAKEADKRRGKARALRHSRMLFHAQAGHRVCAATRPTARASHTTASAHLFRKAAPAERRHG